jgi:4-amino-4-deoxy-L-arabinose transferase-like glycosyltransferase
VPIRLLGMQPWVARLPNLLYALLTACCVGLLARRLAGPMAGLVAGAGVGTFLLGYQVLIWLATDAPVLAFTSVALLGMHIGLHATTRRGRLGGYTLMHAGLALAFLGKSVFGWLVPVLALATLLLWERRWRELLRWELYAGLLLQAVLILGWVGAVYAGPDGLERLKVFFWNNLAGRITRVDAPAELQYATGHRNTPGKYFIEMPVYLWPWTLLVLAALRQAWRASRQAGAVPAALRFAAACGLPALLLLSFAATARNVYMGPVMPGFALLLGWWATRADAPPDAWDRRAIRGTAILLILASAAAVAAWAVLRQDSDNTFGSVALAWAGVGVAASVALAVRAWRGAGQGAASRTLAALFLSYVALLIAPAWTLYGEVDRGQDLARMGGWIKADVGNRPLILIGPDETTRAFVDMHVSTQVERIPEAELPHAAPEAGRRIASQVRAAAGRPYLLVQIDGRGYSAAIRRIAGRLVKGEDRVDIEAWSPPWLADSGLRIVKRYGLPNGRRYALLEPAG